MEYWKETVDNSPIKHKTQEKPKKGKKIKRKRSRLPALFLLIVLLAGILVYIQWPRYELVTLGSLGGSFGTAEAINNNGQIAGWSQLSNGDNHAFIWDTQSGLKDIGTIGGNNSYARDLNDKGQVVGYAENLTGSRHAFIWNPSEGMTELITPEGDDSEAVAINNNGQVVGIYDTNDGRKHAFLWDAKTEFEDLGTLYGRVLQVILMKKVRS